MTGLVGSAKSAHSAAQIIAAFLSLALGQTEWLTLPVVADRVSRTVSADIATAIGPTLQELPEVIDTIGLAGTGASEGELAAGVGADAGTAIAPVRDPATPICTALLDRDGALVGTEHEDGAVAATNIWDVATAGGGNALACLALGAGGTEFWRQPARTVVCADRDSVAFTFGGAWLTYPWQAGPSLAEGPHGAASQGHPLAIVRADHRRVAVTDHFSRFAVEGDAVAIFGAVLKVRRTEAATPAAAIVTTSLVDTIGSAIALAPWCASEIGRAGAAEVTATIRTALFVVAIRNTGTLAIVAIVALDTEAAPAATAIGTALFAGAIGYAVCALGVRLGAGSGDRFFVALGPRFEVVAHIFHATSQLQEDRL